MCICVRQLDKLGLIIYFLFHYIFTCLCTGLNMYLFTVLFVMF